MRTEPDPAHEPATIQVRDGHVLHTCCGKLDYSAHRYFCEHYRAEPRTEPAEVQPPVRTIREASTATRVVLVAPRSDSIALAGAVLVIERLGWSLVAIVDPESQRDALAMVVDGLADTVVPLRQEYVTVLSYLDDLEHGDKRTRPVARRPRIVASGLATRDRRPQLIGHDEQPVEVRRTELVERRPAILPREERTQITA